MKSSPAKRKGMDKVMLRNSILSPLSRLWYDYLSRADQKGEVLFLNYGYANGEDLELHEEDEINRYGIQLYHHTVNGVDLTNKKILEIGCGKGGGAHYISRYFKPELIIGMDRSKEEIKFNHRHYQGHNLSFAEGDALAIPFPENSFHVVLNVESSHHYLNFDQFLSEVRRVLKPDGYFLFTDFRIKQHITPMFRSFEHSGLNIIEKEDISKSIIQALDLDFERRMHLVEEILPKFLHRWARFFSGVKDTSLYESFKTGGRKYFYLLLRKPSDQG